MPVQLALSTVTLATVVFWRDWCMRIGPRGCIGRTSIVHPYVDADLQLITCFELVGNLEG
jgi:hypothetical protein